MPQISLYVDKPTMDSVRQSAQRKNISISSYVAGRLREPEPDQEETVDGWPESFWQTYGALDDAFERPNQLDWSLDAPRQTLDGDHVSA